MTDMDPNLITTFTDITSARVRVSPYIHTTPILTSTFFNHKVGAEIYFKCENLQKAGAFKVRGASNAVFSLTEEEAANGVVTHSSGNHGQALAYAAQQRGIPCYVVMPSNAPEAKKAAVKGYGAVVTECEPTNSAREFAAKVKKQETGANFVPPFNDPRVISGQGTCALEIFEQVENLDYLVAPIGGGGLISGLAIAAAELSPNTKVVAAEPLNANDAAMSFESGRLTSIDAPQTIADGLKVNVKELTFYHIQKHVDQILTATEEQIIEAMYLTWQRMKIVIEPACAVPMATILANPEIFRGKRIAVVLTGGNVDLDALPWM